MGEGRRCGKMLGEGHNQVEHHWDCCRQVEHRGEGSGGEAQDGEGRVVMSPGLEGGGCRQVRKQERERAHLLEGRGWDESRLGFVLVYILLVRNRANMGFTNR